MRALLIGPCLALALAACNETTPQSLLTQAQADALTTCSFLPTAETVASIVAKGNATVSTAEQIATAICSAIQAAGVTPASGATALLAAQPPAGTAQPQVLGVPVHGRFVGDTK